MQSKKVGKRRDVLTTNGPLMKRRVDARAQAVRYAATAVTEASSIG